MKTHTLHLTKGDQKYYFRYAQGSEDRVVDEIVAMVEDRNYNIDWLDAANLSFQITQYAADSCSDELRTGSSGAKDGPCNNCP